MFDRTKSLQGQYAPHNACFGCGPANDKGLQIQSFVDNDIVVAQWLPEVHHEAFPGMLNGGIIGALLDCHSNWSAAYHLMLSQNLDKPPCTVTAYFNVSLKRPTSSQSQVSLTAKIAEIKGDQVIVNASLSSGGKVCATCVGKFVAVKEGHPAFHRW
tara:strand:+ start:198210 stop:198680 length:471 start_codon:yes stop_codon:yes gene_type:complete